MCRVLTREYPPLSASVAEARRWAGDVARRWAIDELRTRSMVLQTSELVTNAVLHARSPLTLTLAVAAGVLEVGVGDHDPRPPTVRPRGSAELDWLLDGPGLPSQGRHGGEPAVPEKSWWRSLSTGGRGLFIVQELADEWGVSPAADGKQVWFRLDVGRDWPHRTACPCQGEDLGRLRLESGRYALAVPGPWDAE